MSRAKELYDSALQQFKNENTDEAIRLLHEAIRADSHFPDAYEALGLLYFRQKRLDEALDIMQELARIEPENIMAHTNLSRIYVAKGLIEEAEKEQAEARRLSWKSELKAKIQKGEAVPAEIQDEAAAQKRLEEKIQNYRKVIELDPKDVLGYFSLGTAYLEGKMYGPAREAFEQAVGVNADHTPSYLGWGQALEALGRTHDAIMVYEGGVAAGQRRGDIIPMKKMETRLARLQKK